MVCVYIQTHTYNGGYQITVDFFIMEYHFIFEQLQKTKIMRKLRTIVAILATLLLEFVVCAHHVFIVRIGVHTRADFTPATMITAGPTGIRIFR